MPAWLQHLLEGLSPEGAGLTVVGAIITTVVTAVVKGIRAADRDVRNMQRVPPSDPPPEPREPRDPSEYEERVRAIVREQTTALIVRVSVLEGELAEARHQLSQVGEDHARTAAALSASREEVGRLRDENGKLHDYCDELLARMREDTGVRAHLPPHPKTRSSPALQPVLPHDVIEVDDRDNRPTPPQGTPRLKR